MYELVQEYSDLMHWFFSADDRQISKGCYVSTKIRRQAMLSNNQGTVVRNGKIRVINFKNMSGGVWHATLKVEI